MNRERRLALFGRKKAGDNESTATEQPAESAKGGKGAAFAHDPAKAKRWYDHAATMHESGNFEYATTCWLKGLSFDPANQERLESFFKSAQAYAASQKKPGPSREQLKAFDAKSPVERYLLALLQWGCRPEDSSAAVKAMEAAAKLGLRDAAAWIGGFALRAARAEKKPKKDTFVKLKDLFVEIEAFDQATKAGEDALFLDRSDAALEDQVRNLSAQAAMRKGGYEEAGEEGAFRKSIRDSESQRRVQEQDNVVKSEDAKDRSVAETRADYESRPTDSHSIGAYVRRLLERGAPEDEKTAHKVLLKAFEETREFRFRQQAGELELRWVRRQLAKIKEAAEARPDDAAAQQRYQKAKAEALEREVRELGVRVDAYPTDLGLRFELGKRQLQLGRPEEAIANLQQSQNDGKHRVQSLGMLGHAFETLGWHTEAVETFRNALQAHHTHNDKLGMDLRYGLMVALQEKGRQDRDTETVQEAIKIASGIAMQDISFKDIRERREHLQALLRELRPE